MTALLFLTLVLWGTAFAGIRAGLESYSPLNMATLRFIVASLVLLPFFIWKKSRWPDKKDWLRFLGAALFAVPGYHVTLNMGEKYVTASSASLLLSTLPLWTVLWARLFLGEKYTRWTWGGFALAFLGAAIISLGEGSGFEMNWATSLVLLSALSGSIFTAMQKRLLERYSAFEVNCFVIWLGTLLMLPFSFSLTEQMKTATFHATASVIYLGVFPAALAFVLWAQVLQKIPASRAVSFLYLVPLFATLSGWLWLNEWPHPMALLGGLLALSGVLIVNVWGKPEPSVEKGVGH